MISTKYLANAVGGRNARACDGCVRKRARWYCAADDAFLCQSCDSSVHSANPLARRHERVRLKSSSLKPSIEIPNLELSTIPSWHRGLTRKARTPRGGKPSPATTDQTQKLQEQEEDPVARNPFLLVPEVGGDETLSHEENEEQLLYRVPIFDPFVAELCTPNSATSGEGVVAIINVNDLEEKDAKLAIESKVSLIASANHGADDSHKEYLPSDMELAEFAADVESLLGRGLENECIGMEELGLLDCKAEHSGVCSVGSEKVKVEEAEEGTEVATATPCQIETHLLEMERETFEFSFDYESPETCEDEEKAALKNITEFEGKDPKKVLLSLDYEGVIAAWSSQGSPWTTGDRTDFDANECWPDRTDVCGIEFYHHTYGNELGGIGCHTATSTDGGREARVSRYREKRRTRLFSKKIRYEVRKLNAEKRPRIKGRFVKRASFSGPGFHHLSK